MTTPNKRWRELAQDIQRKWRDTTAIFHAGKYPDLSAKDIEILEIYIAQAIETAVNEEQFSDVHTCHDNCQRAFCVRIRERIAKAVAEDRARMVIVWPSEDRFIEMSNLYFENDYDEIAIFDWVKQQAKIGERDEKA